LLIRINDAQPLKVGKRRSPPSFAVARSTPTASRNHDLADCGNRAATRSSKSASQPSAEETLPPLNNGKAPETVEELWTGFDPRKEPPVLCQVLIFGLPLFRSVVAVDRKPSGLLALVVRADGSHRSAANRKLSFDGAPDEVA
jgi:hypothetical protein